MKTFADKIIDYVSSGHAILSVLTSEKERAITEITKGAIGDNRQIRIWSISTGWTDCEGNSVGSLKVEAPVEQQLKLIRSESEGTIFILRDFGHYLDHKTYSFNDVVVSTLDDLKKTISAESKTIIMVGPCLDIPQQLLHDITSVSFDLPNKEQIEERIRFACNGVFHQDGTKFELEEAIIPNIVAACKGMTSQQIVDRVTLSLRIHKTIDEEAVKTILSEKAGIVKSSGLLSYMEVDGEGLSCVGGYDEIKHHVSLDAPCFSDEARDFGIEFPKGLMLVGVSGCGKTLISKAIASELSLPLIAMDVGNLMSKYVGESEQQTRSAIKMIESIAPCVLQLDEIEKGFGVSGGNDGGSSGRVFGTFIKWLNDRTSPVYVVATANQVQSLPPEFCRKGRFDEIYGLGLPCDDERYAIFKIHISKKNRDVDDFNIEELVSLTAGFTGADIEQVVKLGLKLAFSDSKVLTQKHLEQAIDRIIPLSKTEPERINSIKEWCDKHTKQANTTKKKNKNIRRVSLS